MKSAKQVRNFLKTETLSLQEIDNFLKSWSKEEHWKTFENSMLELHRQW